MNTLNRFSTSEMIGFFTPSVIDALVLMCASKNKQLKRQVGLQIFLSYVRSSFESNKMEMIVGSSSYWKYRSKRVLPHRNWYSWWSGIALPVPRRFCKNLF